jgi:hypothetical protein
MRKSRIRHCLAFIPLLCVIAMWVLCDVVESDVPLWHYRGPDRGVNHDCIALSLTAYNAVEIAFQTDSIWINDETSGYYNNRVGPAILGAYVGYIADGGAAKTFDIMIPFWLLAIVAGSGPAIYWGMRVRRETVIRARQSKGQCLCCGYDLRATADRCPECGTALGRVIETQ